jgi:hypothetical protein
MFKRMLVLLLSACGGMAVDSMPDGGVDGTHNPEYSDAEEKASDDATQEKWCIGCLAGVSVPRHIDRGMGLRPINETIGGKSLQFPGCQGTQSSMPHACRLPTGNAVFFGPPPSAWSVGRKNVYWDAVYLVGAELGNAGWNWTTSQNGPDPWDSGAARYQHTEILTKPDISNSPHPLARLTLQGIQNTTVSNLKTYLACEIEFDWTGPNGILNNGGNCTGQCVNGWSAANAHAVAVAAFRRNLLRCTGLGGDQLSIYEHPVGSNYEKCFSADEFWCGAGGGDGLLRKEWLPAGWWSQVFSKNCTGNDVNGPCANVFPVPMGQGTQFISGSGLLWTYLH